MTVLGNFGLGLPASLTHSPCKSPEGYLNLPAALIALIVTGILYAGTKHSAQMAELVVGPDTPPVLDDFTRYGRHKPGSNNPFRLRSFRRFRR